MTLLKTVLLQSFRNGRERFVRLGDDAEGDEAFDARSDADHPGRQ